MHHEPLRGHWYAASTGSRQTKVPASGLVAGSPRPRGVGVPPGPLGRRRLDQQYAVGPVRRRHPRRVLQQFRAVGHAVVRSLGRPGRFLLAGQQRVSRRLARPRLRVSRAQRLVGRMDRYTDLQLQRDVHLPDQLSRQRSAAVGYPRRTAARQSGDR